MNEDYKRGYRDGFSDGVKHKEHKTFHPSPPPILPTMTCQKCGIILDGMSFCTLVGCPQTMISYD